MTLSGEETNDLLQLFGGYFNQDFEDAGDWIGEPTTDGVIAFLVENSSPNELLTWIGPLEKLRDAHHDEATLYRIIFRELRSSYNPTIRSDDLDRYATLQSWIEHIVDLLRAGLQEKSKAAN